MRERERERKREREREKLLEAITGINEISIADSNPAT